MAKKKETTAVVKPPTYDLAEYDPELAALFASDNKDDFERIDQEDFSLPRINLMNFTSKLVKLPNAEGGCEAGLWACNVDDALYTSEPKEHLVVVPVYHYKSRINFHDMNSDKKGTKCQSPDYLHGVGDPGGTCEKCPLQEWTNEPPECDKTHNFVVIVPGADEQHRFGVMSFRSTGFPSGKQWFQLSNTAGKGRLFTRAYRVGLRLDSKKDNTYYVPELVKWDGLNRYDCVLPNAFKDEGVDWIQSLLREAMACSDMIEKMRKAGTFKVADDVNDDVDIDGEATGMEEKFAAGGSDDDLPWDDIETGAE